MLLLLLISGPFAGAFLSYLIGRRSERARNLFDVLLTLAVLLTVGGLYPAVSQGPLSVHVPQLMGTGLDLRVGPLQYLLLLLTAFIWFIGTVFLIQYVPARLNRNRFHFFYLLTFAGSLGFFAAENILNQFTFFEILSLSAYFLIIHDEDEYAHQAGTLYVTMAILGGLLVLMGILTAYEATGTLMLDELAQRLPAMETERTIVGSLLFIGYMVKAGIFPLHIWVPKAYAAAPAPATVILTGVLAKTGLYGLYTTIVLLTGSNPVFAWAALILGALTLLHGGLMALFQRNIKRLLAFGSMSQYGLILGAIGLGALAGPEGAEATAGAFMMMVNHSLFKAMAFLSIGLLYLRVSDLSLNQIHGIGRRAMPMTAAILFSALAAWGFPGFSGYWGKTLVHDSLAHWAHTLPHWGALVSEGLFTLGSALTAAYTLKLISALVVDPSSEFSGLVWLKRQKRSYVPLLLAGTAILLLGFLPAPVTAVISGGLGHSLALPAVTAEHLVQVLIPVSLGILLHFVITRRLLRKVTDGEICYINPLSSGPTLETHFYMPIAGALIGRSTAVFTLFDSGLSRAVTSVGELLRSADAALKSRSMAGEVLGTPAAPTPPADTPLAANTAKGVPLPATSSAAHADEGTAPLSPARPPVSVPAGRAAAPAANPFLPAALRLLATGTSGLTFALYVFGAFLVIILLLMLIR